MRWSEGDPCGDGGETERCAEPEVAEDGEAFGERIAREPGEDGEGENQRPGVAVEGAKAGGGEREEQQAQGECEAHEGGGDGAGDAGACGGAGIGGIEGAVEQAVGGHGPGAGEDHAGEDEPKATEARGGERGNVDLPKRPEGRDEGEGEREDAVGEFDHVEEGADFLGSPRGGGSGRESSGRDHGRGSSAAQERLACVEGFAIKTRRVPTEGAMHGGRAVHALPVRRQ